MAYCDKILSTVRNLSDGQLYAKQNQKSKLTL